MEMLEQKGGRLIVHLPGELDHHHTENIRAAVDHMIRTTLVGEVEFDFSETLFMDSAGIGLLIGRYQMMQAFHGRVLISHVNEQIERILELSGIEKYIRLEKEETDTGGGSRYQNSSVGGGDQRHYPWISG